MPSTRKTDIRHTTPDERYAIARLASKIGITGAARLARRNWATVRTCCRETGVRPKQVKQNTPAATRARAVALYAKGKHSFAEVGAKFGVTGVRVWQWVQDAKR